MFATRMVTSFAASTSPRDQLWVDGWGCGAGKDESAPWTRGRLRRCGHLPLSAGPRTTCNSPSADELRWPLADDVASDTLTRATEGVPMIDCDDLNDLRARARDHVHLAVIARATRVAEMHIDLAIFSEEQARAAEQDCDDD
jgi:hypothetical protein